MLLLLGGINSQAHERYWVVFSNKCGSTLNSSDFHPDVFERISNRNGSYNDSSDFPLSGRYIERVKAITNNLGHHSRWFNAIAVKATHMQVNALRKLSFVEDIIPIQGEFFVAKYKQMDKKSTEFEDLRARQVARFNAEAFRSNGINGKGVRIAIFDAGFPGVDSHQAFEHIRRSNKIIATYDFTRNKANVYRGNQHGTMVLACIAGLYNGKPMGLATEAEFMLAITEVGREPFSEEENWVAALEWAHRNGAQIVNSSLGYTYHRYYPEQMDGRSTFISRAAAKAASKGILVVNAAGNEGDSRWEVIGAPADADSILTVGGVSPYDHLHISFASYGPTVDGRLKPNVSAFGTALVANKKGGYSTASGTSFASPLTAGFAACALQATPGVSARELLTLIERSGDLYPYFDYAHGYGVPQATPFMSQPDTIPIPEFISFNENGDAMHVWINNFESAKLTGYNTTHMFWHIRKPNGTLAEYGVIRVYQAQAFSYNYNSLQIEKGQGFSLWVNYLGRTYSVNL